MSKNRSGDKIETKDIKDKWAKFGEITKPGDYSLIDMQTFPNGFRQLIDNTPGKATYMLDHPSGTGTTITNDGSVSIKTVANKWDYTKAGSTSTVDGNSDSKTGGHQRNSVKGGQMNDTLGNVHEVEAGSDPNTSLSLKEQKIAGTIVTISASQKIVLIAPEVSINSTIKTSLRGPVVHIFGYNTLTMNSGGPMDINATGAMKVKGATITAWGEPIHFNP